MSVFKRPIGRWMLPSAFVLALGLTGALWVSAPDSSAQSRVRQCLFNHNCQAPLVCAGDVCRAACATDRDCHNGWVCLNEVWEDQRFVRTATQADLNARRSTGVCRPPPAGSAQSAVPAYVSAVPAAAEPPTAQAYTVQYGWARYGTNIGGRIDLETADPDSCAIACAKEDGCRSWTYVKPGYQAKHAVCWIKSDNPAPVPDECCVTDGR